MTGTERVFFCTTIVSNIEYESISKEISVGRIVWSSSHSSRSTNFPRNLPTNASPEQEIVASATEDTANDLKYVPLVVEAGEADLLSSLA